MKKFIRLFIVFLFVTSNICFSQTTWVKILGGSSSGPYLHSDSTTIGPSQLVVSPNGTIYTFIQESPDHDIELFAIDTSGQILWNMGIARHGGIYWDDAYGLHTTADNGCIYYVQHTGSYIGDSIVRRDSTGAIVWHKEYSNYLSNPHDMVNNLSQTFYNTTIVQFEDSLVEYGPSGNFIQDIVPFSRNATLYHLPDSDFIRNESPLFRRENLAGVIKWSIQMPGFKVSAANLDFVLLKSDSQVVKIDASNGNTIWTKPVLSANLVPTSDLGFIASFENTLSKYDSSGQLQWNKLIQLPHFGLRGLVEIPGKSFVSGGAWFHYNFWHPMFNGYNFSPILFNIDSVGNSVLDSVNNFINGNANDNTTLAFGDDAVYIAAAFNKTGTPRDPALRNAFPGNMVFASDWESRFASGLNHKFSDLDGNGFINFNDLIYLSYLQYPLFYYDNIRPHWLKQSSVSTLPDLKFLFENQSLNYLDTIVIDVVLGSTLTPVDSIYGISFDLTIGEIYPFGLDMQSYYSVPPNALGDTSQNLFVYYNYYPNNLPRSSFCVLCRTDHTNAIVAGDTLIKIYYILPQVTTYNNPITMYINWNAITEGGFPVALNNITNTLYLSGVNEVGSLTSEKIRISPNPVNDLLKIRFNDIDEYAVKIFNDLGNVIYNNKVEGNSAIVNVKGFKNGIYFISAESKAGILRSKFIIQHQ